ncbi:MAG: protein kinase [Myxococcota bacterium]
MDAQGFQRAYAIFMALEDLGPGERTRALDEACGADGDLRRFLEQLFDDEQSLETFENALNRAIGDAAGTPAELVRGSLVDGRFRVEGALGRGGTASVWRVHDVERDLPLALKVLDLVAPSTRERMARERAFQGQVRHRNVTRVFGRTEVDGRPALILELVEGPDLSAYLKTHTLTDAQTDAVASGILAGLQAIHDARLVHRDIKPSNVLLSPEGGELVPKVTDFGIARALETDAPTAHLTRTGALVGTLAYMAPEQIRDARRVDARTDLWAVGCLLFRLATGREAFVGRDNGELLNAILAGRRAALPPELPERWRVAIDAALQVRPDDRPGSCTELRRLGEAPEGVMLWRGRLPGGALTTMAPSAEVPHLPAPRDRFIGRVEALEDLAQLVQDRRLVTVVGVGGLGKTRLAIELGRRLQDEGQAVHLVRLADTRSAIGIQAAVASTLGITANGNDDLVRALTDAGPLVLVLDNFEQIVDHAPETVGVWLDAVPTLRVIATSRAPLKLYGEASYPLDLLALDEAIELFGQRARMAAPSRSPDAHRPVIEELVQLLDRLPLAIELAAARSRLLSPRALLARMSQRFELLRVRTTDVPERQRTLRATLQWSWELLTPLQQSVLAQLSVFEGGCTIEAAQQVVELGTDGWVEDVLAELVSQSLVLVRDERLRMLVSVQAFAREQLADAPAVEARHGAWFATFAGQLARPESERFPEIDNLLVGARRAIHRGDPKVAAPLTKLAARLFYIRSPLRAGLDLVAEVLPHVVDPVDRSSLLRIQGRLVGRGGHPQDALPYLEQGLALARESDARQEHVYILSELGELAGARGAWEASRALFEEAAAVAARDGSAGLRLLPVIRLAGLALFVSDYPEAERLLHQALALSKDAGRPLQDSYIHGMLGNLRYRQNRYDEAERHYQTAWGLARKHGDLPAVATWQGGVACVLEQTGRFREAAECFREVVRISREVESAAVELHWMTYLGALLYRLGELAESEARLRGAVALAEARDLAPGLLNAQANLGHVLTLTGRLDEAEPLLRQAYAAALEMDEVNKELDVFDALADLLDRRGQVEEAAPVVAAGLSLARRLARPVGIARFLALSTRFVDDVDAARRDLDEAERQVRQTHNPYAQMLLLAERGRLEHRLGEASRASEALAAAHALVDEMALPAASEIRQVLGRARPETDA